MKDLLFGEEMKILPYSLMRGN